MESLLRRWDRCAESRRQLVETQVGQVLGEAREDGKMLVVGKCGKYREKNVSLKFHVLWL